MCVYAIVCFAGFDFIFVNLIENALSLALSATAAAVRSLLFSDAALL